MSSLSQKPPACDSVFDVAFWFLDRALEDGEYLQPQKMQRLLYLSQAYYGVLSRGQRLIPCLFLATVLGPVEPTSWRIFEGGRPSLAPHPLPDDIQHFLNSIWRRFGSHGADYLARMIMAQPPFQDAVAIGKRCEISLESMVAYYGRSVSSASHNEGGGAPALDQVVRPKVLRSHKGKPVSVTSWVPRRRLDQGQ
ncbi:hypothetical protein HEQ63_01005 [Haematospirillum jordaniae]|uniref:Panacea domain-containing protein n=1 Tax=Haematospirillum jordaniae TaxID=1549855 RepID=UPI001432D355|nr:hypothetical protein [Haematospirillum jordaniae]NKD84772.1 hypothetical protein [Haematospirillum jordaniae]